MKPLILRRVPVLARRKVEIQQAYPKEDLDPVPRVGKDVGQELVHVHGAGPEDQRHGEDPVQQNGARGRFLLGPVARPEAREGEGSFLGELLLHAWHGEGLRKDVAERREREEERHHAVGEG